MRSPDWIATPPARLAFRVAGIIARVLLGVLAAAAVAVIGPRVAGYVPLTVLTDSMQPAFSAGDIAYTKPPVAGELEIGDVVAFHPYSANPTLIIHRIVDTTADGFVTRGDANGADDEPIVAGQIAGVMDFTLPLLGHFQQWLTPWGVAVAMGSMLWVYFAPTGVSPKPTPKEVPVAV